MKIQLDITLDTSALASLTGRAPLLDFTHHGESYNAYLLLDENGKVYTDTRAPWDNGCPIDEWHGCTRTWKIPAAADGDALRDALSDMHILELLQRVRNGHRIEWDGNNYVGVLDDDAEEASEELENYLGDLTCWDIWGASDFLSQTDIDNNLWPAGQTLEQVVADIEADARGNGVLLVEDANAIAQVLCEKLLEQLEDNDNFALTAEQREALEKYDTGRLADIEAERAEAV